MSHPVQCSCGALKGSLDGPVTRVVCYCRDCQAFAHFLGRAGEILDGQGGSDICQTQPRRLTFSAGAQNLACVRLSESGLLRWYTKCCRTPIGNTTPNYRTHFVGLLHSCLESSDAPSLDDAFGPGRAVVNTGAARGEPKPAQSGTLGMIVRFVGRMLVARVTGAYRTTPFFDVATGDPVAAPEVLSAERRTVILRAVDGVG